MAKPKNPNNRYNITCKITGKVFKTNPRQFFNLVRRYRITPNELDNSYVSCEGRRIIKKQNLTPFDAHKKYGIHLNVADFLNCTLKEPFT